MAQDDDLKSHVSTTSALRKAGSQISKPSMSQSIISKLKQDREAVQAVKDKYTRKTSLFGSEEYTEPKFKEADRFQTSLYGSEELFRRPAKAIVPQKETTLYGNEVEKPYWRKQFEAQGMKSRIFEFQNDIIPIKTRPTAAQASMVFEFCFNPDITPSGELQRPKQDVIYDDDRYSNIGSQNRNFNEAEKKEQQERREKRYNRWVNKHKKLQQIYDELRQEMPQECNDFQIVEKVKQRIKDKYPEIGTVDGVQIRNPLTMQLISTKDADYKEDFPLSKPTQYKIPPQQEYLEYIEKGHQIPRIFQDNKRDNDPYVKFSNGTTDEQKLTKGKRRSDFYQQNHLLPSKDQKEFFQKLHTAEMDDMLAKYRDSHYVPRKQLRVNDEINDSLYHKRQEEADHKATLIVNNKFYGGDPNNPMVHDKNTPLITPSELNKLPKREIKYKTPEYEPPVINVRNEGDALKKYMLWKNDGRSQVSRKSTKSQNKSMLAPSNHVSQVGSSVSRNKK